MQKPRCKKCGRVLRDPVSIAAGLGPECRGDAGRGKNIQLHRRQPSGKAIRLAANHARAEALAAGEPVTMGRDPHTHEPVIYKPDEHGNYVSPSGVVISISGLQDWMAAHGLITSITENPGVVRTSEQA